MLAALVAYPQDSKPAGSKLSGKVTFKGKAPKRRKIDTSADPVCQKIHENDPLQSESVIVNDNGTLRNAFVYVKDGLGDKKFPAPAEAVVLNQQGCRYEPHVFGIMVGQKLTIRNSDETMHNIHGSPAINSEFNFSQAKKGQENERTFDQPEIMVSIKCDVHGWMNCFAGVLTHPFFAVTDDKGAFEIKNLPPGEYTIAVWHEKLGTQEQKIKVGDETKEIEFTFEGK
jgi:plastocyanin